jgi:hypothetical protein
VRWGSERGLVLVVGRVGAEVPGPVQAEQDQQPQWLAQLVGRARAVGAPSPSPALRPGACRRLLVRPRPCSRNGCSRSSSPSSTMSARASVRSGTGRPRRAVSGGREQARGAWTSRHGACCWNAHLQPGRAGSLDVLGRAAPGGSRPAASAGRCRCEVSRWPAGRRAGAAAGTSPVPLPACRPPQQPLYGPATGHPRAAQRFASAGRDRVVRPRRTC